MGHPHQVQHHRRLGLFDSAPGQWQTGCHAPTPRLFRRTSQPQHSHWPRTSMSPSSFSSACDHSLPVFTADGSSSPSAVADRGSKCRPKDMSRRDGSSPRSRTSCCWSAAFIVRGDRRQPHGSFLTPRWREGDSNPRSQVKKNPLVETVCSTFPAFPFRDGPRRVYSPPPNLGACSTQIAHRRYVLYLRKCSSRSAPEHRQPLAGLAPLPSRFLPRRTEKRNGRDGSLLDSSRDRRIFGVPGESNGAPCPRW